MLMIDNMIIERSLQHPFTTSSEFETPETANTDLVPNDNCCTVLLPDDSL